MSLKSFFISKILPPWLRATREEAREIEQADETELDNLPPPPPPSPPSPQDNPTEEIKKPVKPQTIPEYIIIHHSIENSLLHTIDPQSLEDPNEICSICQTPFIESQEPIADTNKDMQRKKRAKPIVETPCGHRFCSRCINRVIDHQIYKRDFHCPNCRQPWDIIFDVDGPHPNGGRFNKDFGPPLELPLVVPESLPIRTRQHDSIGFSMFF